MQGDETRQTEYVFANGSVTWGPILPKELNFIDQHCMVQLHNESILILGGVKSHKVFLYNQITRKFSKVPGIYQTHFTFRAYSIISLLLFYISI